MSETDTPYGPSPLWALFRSGVDTPFEFAVLEFLKEEGLKASIEPINIELGCPSWAIYVVGPIKLVITITDGIIKLEGFSLGTEFGRFEIAAPDSLDQLVGTIRDSFQEAGACGDRRMAKRERHLRHCRIGR